MVWAAECLLDSRGLLLGYHVCCPILNSAAIVRRPRPHSWSQHQQQYYCAMHYHDCSMKRFLHWKRCPPRWPV
eukprot:g9632.t1